MADRVPGFVTGSFDMYRGGSDKFYSEKQKYKQLLASHERKKQRYKARERRERSRRHSKHWEEDIVKTGSEEDAERSVRPRRNTRKRSMRKRDDDLMAAIERRERLLQLHIKRNEQHYLSPKDTKQPDEYSYRSTVRKNYGDHTSYLRPLMEDTGRPFYPEMEPVIRPLPYPVESARRPVYKMASDQESLYYPAKPKYYSHIPLPETLETDRLSDLAERKDARHKRASVLNRVEHLLNDMNRQIYEGDILLKSKSSRRNENVQYIKRKDDIDSGDDTYVFVKTTVTPEPAPFVDSHSDADVSLPSLPASSLGPQRGSQLSFPSGIKSEIQGAYSDEEADGHPDPRPFTDSYRGHPFTLGGAGRYEQSKLKNGMTNNSVKTVPALPGTGKRNEIGARGKLVTFYKNGDRNYKGLTIAVNTKKWLNIDKLKEHLTDKMGTSYPVKYIFTIPDGQLIDHLDKFDTNRSYIVCKDRSVQVKGIQYGYSNEKHWVTKRPSAGKVRKNDLGMLKQNAPANSPSRNRRVITIIQNKNRIRKEKVILNPETSMSFEQILSDMGDMINMNATALYLYKKPEVRVTNYSQLFREYKTVDEFIICGEEQVPLQEEPGQKRTAPSSNSSNESVTSRGSRQNKIQKSTFDGDVQLQEEAEEYGLASDRTPSPPQYEGMRWEDTLEHVPFDDPLDNDDDIVQTIKVKIRGKFKGESAILSDDIILSTPKEYFEPNEPIPEDRCKPNQKLILEWLYGYRSHDDSNSMLIYQKTGELVCYMDSAVVFYNRTFEFQRYYLAHTEEITCMALHPEGVWIATGQKAGTESDSVAHIRIWDGRTLSTQVVLGVGIFTSGLCAVNFSVFGDGFLLCAVDSSDKHVLTVWNWKAKRLIAKTTTTTRNVTHACFYPFDDTILITYGQQHLYFWKLFWDQVRDTDGRLLRDKESGVFQTEDPREITSIAFPPRGDVITGDSTGAVVIWAVDRATYVFRYHSTLPDKHHRSVSSLCMMPDSILLSGGGKEIKAWDTTNSYRKTKERVLADTVGDVAAIVLKDKGAPDGGRATFFIGTTRSCILEGSFEDKLKKQIEAHFDTVAAVVSHPKEGTFFSASLDGTVKKWSADKHRLVWTKNTEKPCSCLDIDRKGLYLAVGTADGYVMILGVYMKELATIKIGTSSEFIECIKFSPEREMLAVGVRDGCVYVYNDVNFSGNLAIRNNTIFKANSMPVINIDWTTNSHYIQTMSSNYDLFHWDVTDMVAGRALAFRDATWQTQSVTIGYNVCGMWTNLKDDEEVKVSTTSHNNEIIAAGDSRGRIRLYKYPCASSRPEYKVTRMYSNDVTALSFLSKSERLISCGGQKSVLAQWRVENSNTET